MMMQKKFPVWNSQHSLQEVIAPSEFKSYDELKQKLDRVLGIPSTAICALSCK